MSNRKWIEIKTLMFREEFVDFFKKYFQNKAIPDFLTECGDKLLK